MNLMDCLLPSRVVSGKVRAVLLMSSCDEIAVAREPKPVFSPEERRERHRAASLKYQRSNPKKRRAERKRYVKRHHDNVLAYARKYYAENRERILRQKKEKRDAARQG